MNVFNIIINNINLTISINFIRNKFIQYIFRGIKNFCDNRFHLEEEIHYRKCFESEKLNCKDLGIGVAERYNISKSKEKASYFLCLTPNLCSSSTITNPTLLKDIDSDNRACVPIIISVVPLLVALLYIFFSFPVCNLESKEIR